MAKSKFKTVDMSEEAVQTREEKLAQKRTKKLTENDAPKLDTAPEAENVEPVGTQSDAPAQEAPAVAKAPKARGKKYAGARSQIDKTKSYSLEEGIELLKKVTYTKFDESVEVHVNLKEITTSVDVTYPHSTGKTIRVAILNDDILANLDKGVIAFDVLLATPAQMGKITKFARLLGPKGLMPNPKNGTLTGDPAKRKAELEGGKISVKGEKKAPLLHTTVGKLSLSTSDLTDNIRALIAAFGMGKVLKVTLCTSMSPGIRVTV